MGIDHVTYAVSDKQLHDSRWEEFFRLLDMKETDPDWEIERNYEVRWWRDANGTTVHLVAIPELDLLARRPMEHFCVKHVGDRLYEEARASEFKERDSGSGRIWLRGPAGVRVELHP
jgi:hypothetical protein